MSSDGLRWLSRPLLPWPVELRPLPLVLILLGIGLLVGGGHRLSTDVTNYTVAVDLFTGVADFVIAGVLEWRYRRDERGAS